MHLPAGHVHNGEVDGIAAGDVDITSGKIGFGGAIGSVDGANLMASVDINLPISAGSQALDGKAAAAVSSGEKGGAAFLQGE